MVSAPSTSDATFSGVEELIQSWPGRGQQIKLLIQLLRNAEPAPVFVHGPASTGKTAIVKDVLRYLNKTYAYIDCIEHSKPKSAMRSILGQLKGKKRTREDGFAGEPQKEDVREALAQLHDVCAKLRGGPPVVVLDHAERLVDGSSSSSLLATLLRLRESSACSLGCVLISGLAWGSGAFSHGGLAVFAPLPVEFAPYTQEQLAAVLLARRPSEFDPAQYKRLVDILLPIFWRQSRDLSDLQDLATSLYPKWVEPLERGEASPNNAQALYTAFKPYVARVAQSFVPGCGCPDMRALDTVQSGQQQQPSSSSAALASSSSLDFELPYLAKFLLLAGYLASRNKAALDKRLFCSGGGKRRGQMSHDKQVEEARSVAAAGPSAFPRERLLAIFWALLQLEGDEACGAAASAGGACNGGRGADLVLAADVQVQVASLVSLRLLTTVGGEVLEGAQYVCTIPDDMARTLANNVGMNLGNYLFYA